MACLVVHRGLQMLQNRSTVWTKICFVLIFLTLLHCHDETAGTIHHDHKIEGLSQNAMSDSDHHLSAPTSSQSSAVQGGNRALDEGEIETASLLLCNQTLHRVYSYASARCEEKLVSFECCPDNVIARFMVIKDQLQSSFKRKLADGFTLYNCGQVNKNKLRLHWVKKDGYGVGDYQTMSVLGEAAKVDDGLIRCRRFAAL